MTTRAIAFGLWGLLGLYWLISAFGAKQGTRGGRERLPGLLLAALAFLLLHFFNADRLGVHIPALQTAGLLIEACGIGLAVWARVHLGRNWGMPMTSKEEPELVTSGPYRYVRHPIYSGLLLAVLGTALATNLYWLIALAVMGAYFLYSARVEERLMDTAFPDRYPSYRAQTKMLIPFVL